MHHITAELAHLSRSITLHPFKLFRRFLFYPSYMRTANHDPQFFHQNILPNLISLHFLRSIFIFIFIL